MGPADHVYFHLCLALGRLLRSARYAKARIVFEDGKPLVRKSRAFYAPLLIWLGDPLMTILDTGVRVLPQRSWEERERAIYRSLYDASIRVDASGALVLPVLAGRTLAVLLEDPQVDESRRRRAIELAVVALAEFHELGSTHGDAMAENVMVDVDSGQCSGRHEHSSKGEDGVAHWFDFETMHDSSRSIRWRRADDLRALLVTCLVRTVHEKRAETLDLILDAYEGSSRRSGEADTAAEMTRLLAASFASVWQRPLAFHLAQAGLPFQCFREIARLLRERLAARFC